MNRKKRWEIAQKHAQRLKFFEMECERQKRREEAMANKKVVGEAIEAYEAAMRQGPRYVAAYSTAAYYAPATSTYVTWDSGTTAAAVTTSPYYAYTVTMSNPQAPAVEAPKKVKPKEHKPVKPPGLKGGAVEPCEIM